MYIWDFSDKTGQYDSTCFILYLTLSTIIKVTFPIGLFFWYSNHSLFLKSQSYNSLIFFQLFTDLNLQSSFYQSLAPAHFVTIKRSCNSYNICNFILQFTCIIFTRYITYSNQWKTNECKEYDLMKRTDTWIKLWWRVENLILKVISSLVISM